MCKFPSKQKKQTPLRPSLLQKLKEKTNTLLQVMEIETPERSCVDSTVPDELSWWPEFERYETWMKSSIGRSCPNKNLEHS